MRKVEALCEVVDDPHRSLAERGIAIEGLCRIANKGNRTAIEFLARIARDPSQNMMIRTMARDYLMETRIGR